jgi:hypothetical protein
VLHHSHTLHSSHANTSNRWRRAYATHWVTANVESEVVTIERAYFNTHADQYQAILSHGDAGR